MTGTATPGNASRRSSGSKVGDELKRLFVLKHSVGGKLMAAIVASTAIALVVAGLALLASDIRSSRAAWAQDLATEAGFLALSLRAQLAFDDKAGAQRVLEALQARPAIKVAALYDARGNLFAQYPRDFQGSLRELSQYDAKTGIRVRGGTIELLKPVVQEGEMLGTIYVRAHHDASERITAYLRVVGTVMALGLVIAFLAAAWLRGVITRPLTSIVSTARKIVDEHDYSVRAAKTTDDEFGLLVEAFNNMLEQVQVQALALIDTDRRKDEFLATLAHELRNPLAPIRNAVRILGAPGANDLQRKWGEEIIARQVHRMALLLDDLLDVSRITRGKLELKREYVDLGNLVATALETAKPLIDHKRQQVEVELPEQRISLEVDPLRMSQVIGNLLTNAAKYTDPGGVIKLHVRVDSTAVTMSVKDNGIGIAAEKLPGLFTLFSQVDSAVDRAEGGLGIGLALTQGLVGLHGGRVEARSEGLGKGSEFIVRLPASIVNQPAAAHSAKTTTNSLSVTRHGRVLVADDNRDAAESLAMVLRLSGYEVFIAFSGPEALQMGADVRPDAVLLDIGMPGMSGYEVARRIRLEAWGANTRLVAITGWGQQQDKQLAKAMGFDQHLTKPVDPKDVEELLHRLLPAAAATAYADS